MDKEQIKEILMLYRPGRPDPDDPDFAAALESAKRDPELARWLAKHCALHQAVSAKFKRIEVPEGLKQQILSERKVRTTILPRRRAALLAGVGALVVIMAGLAFWGTRVTADNSFSAFRTRMARKVLREYPRMDLETDDAVQIRTYLSQKGQGDYRLPKALEQTPRTGCAVFTWHGEAVSMICFKSAKAMPSSAPDLFLFAIERTAVSNAPATPTPQFQQINKLTTASWREGNTVYVLAGLGGEPFLREHLSR